MKPLVSWKWLSLALAHPRKVFSEGLFFLFVPLPSLSKKTCFLDQEEERSLIPLFLSLRLHGITEGKPQPVRVCPPKAVEDLPHQMFPKVSIEF